VACSECGSIRPRGEPNDRGRNRLFCLSTSSEDDTYLFPNVEFWTLFKLQQVQWRKDGKFLAETRLHVTLATAC
jgi:hypothetical protein